MAKAEDGVPSLQKALTIIKSVDAEKTHPFRQGEAILEINKRLLERFDLKTRETCLVARKINKPTFNPNCFQSLVYKFKWKNANNKFHHFLSTANTHLYSEAAVEHVIESITTKPDFLEKSKKDYGKRAKQ